MMHRWQLHDRIQLLLINVSDLICKIATVYVILKRQGLRLRIEVLLLVLLVESGAVLLGGHSLLILLQLLLVIAAFRGDLSEHLQPILLAHVSGAHVEPTLQNVAGVVVSQAA